jgi:tetratricopeptide (TPR) repeat protein
MTVVRALARGLFVVVLAVPGCAGRSGPAAEVPGGTETDTTSALASEGSTAGAGATAAIELGPTELWMELRERVAEAQKGGTLTVERCTAWADTLLALHVRHGEPYVGARLEAAALLRSCGRHERARDRLVEALEAMPRWARAEALAILGVLAHESGDDGAAIVHLHAALHADPALCSARASLVQILMRIYEGGGSEFARDDILRHLDTWQELEPDEPRVRVQKARFEVIRARREPQAAAAVRREARLHLFLVLRDRVPSTIEADAFVVLCQLLLDEGDDALGLRACRRAHELDPALGSAALLAAPAMLRMRSFEEALQWLEDAATTIDPVDERTRLRLLAVALRGLRRFDDAEEVYGRLLAADPPEPLDLYNRAQLEQYRLDREPAPLATRIEGVRERFAAVVAATTGHPEHAELERRARAEQQALDELLAERSRSTERSMDPRAAELERPPR